MPNISSILATLALSRFRNFDNGPGCPDVAIVSRMLRYIVTYISFGYSVSSFTCRDNIQFEVTKTHVEYNLKFNTDYSPSLNPKTNSVVEHKGVSIYQDCGRDFRVRANSFPLSIFPTVRGRV